MSSSQKINFLICKRFRRDVQIYLEEGPFALQMLSQRCRIWKVTWINVFTVFWRWKNVLYGCQITKNQIKYTLYKKLWELIFLM